MTRRVSIVDDEARIRELLGEVLTEEGHEVHTYPHGRAFLEDVANRKPDLVLLDINMPGVNGWQVKERLDDDLDMADVPVVAITAQGGPSLETSAREGLGFEGFLRKPFELDELLATTRELLDDR